MSCNPCFFFVKAAMINPISRVINEIVLAKYLTLARPNDMAFPFKSVTTIPIIFFPKVAFIGKLSSRVK